MRFYDQSGATIDPSLALRVESYLADGDCFPTSSIDCKEGEMCVQFDSWACTPVTAFDPAQVGDPCLANACDVGLECLDGQCVQLCQLAAPDCPGSQACLSRHPDDSLGCEHFWGYCY